LKSIDHNHFVTEIHRAQFKDLPKGFHAVHDGELTALRDSPEASPWLPKQEKGVRPSCPLPYELNVTGTLNVSLNKIVVSIEARKEFFKERAAGAPFTAYAFVDGGRFVCRNYAVDAGDIIEDSWKLSEFASGLYRVAVYGPNGYYWSFSGSNEDPLIEVKLAMINQSTEHRDAEILVRSNILSSGITLVVRDNAYGNIEQTKHIAAGGSDSIRVSTHESRRWYDLTLSAKGATNYERRFSGRIEDGTWGISDPLIGSR
jgi:phospholipase C